MAKKGQQSIANKDTRDAVETAIEIAKRDKLSQWEDLISPARIKRWGVSKEAEQRRISKRVPA